MFESIRNQSRKLVETLIPPTKRTTIINHRYEEQSLAQRLDVDRVHAILESAQNGDVTDLMSLYRDMVLADNHLQSEFAKRKLAVLGDALSIQPRDKKSPEDVAAADLIEPIFKDHDHYLIACAHLLDSTLYPVSVVEKVFQPSTVPGLRYDLAELVPVPHRLLDYTEGTLMLWDVDEDGLRLGTKHFPDPDRYIVHRGHLLTSPDNWGGPMRSLVFWWLLSAMDRDWWSRFLERFGAPFIIAKYDRNDDASRSKLQLALSAATRLFGLVVSRETDIQLQQASATTSGDAFEKFLAICQREKSKLIVGQTLSAEAQSTGLGSGVSTSQENVRSDFRDFDSLALGVTIRSQLFKQLVRINGLTGRVPTPVWGSVNAFEVQSLSAFLQALATAGLQVGQDGIDTISERLGFPIERLVQSAPAVLPFAAGFPSRIAVADQAIDSIAQSGASDLSRAFRGALAPIRRIIRESQSPSEVEQRITAFYADWSPQRTAPLIEDALVAYAANGSVSGRPR